ncbi:hypothetical protein KAR91_33165 [Candidatus Pacearchaeota archaeon]|nr:hypothetical protein [Candidatus Pacearchaeota archaeon]
MRWGKERLKKATINVRVARYEAHPANEREEAYKRTNPEIFNFDAISIGDEDGQAFLVPLDESDRETAEFIVRAIKAYDGI